MNIQITEKTFKANDLICVAKGIQKKSLIASIDIDATDDIIELDDMNRKFFTEDINIKFYSGEVESEDDIEILSALKDFALSDPVELRYWFGNLPVGMVKLITAWEVNEKEQIKLLLYEGFERI